MRRGVLVHDPALAGRVWRALREARGPEPPASRRTGSYKRFLLLVREIAEGLGFYFVANADDVYRLPPADLLAVIAEDLGNPDILPAVLERLEELRRLLGVEDHE